jgi:hypothetical protein
LPPKKKKRLKYIDKETYDRRQEEAERERRYYLKDRIAYYQNTHNGNYPGKKAIGQWRAEALKRYPDMPPIEGRFRLEGRPHHGKLLKGPALERHLNNRLKPI